MIHCCKFTPKLWLWCRDSSNRWEMEGGSPTKFARPNRGYYRFWPAGSVECEESLSTVAKCRVCRSCWHCFCSKQCSCATHPTALHPTPPQPKLQRLVVITGGNWLKQVNPTSLIMETNFEQLPEATWIEALNSCLLFPRAVRLLP